MASASDNWSLAWRLVAPHLERTPGGRVLILSGGSMGLYACDIAGALGASHRLYVDRDPERRAIAEAYGAETAPSIEPIHQGFDMYLNSVNVRIARDNVRANIPPALAVAQRPEVDPLNVVSHVLDWETLPDALPELHTKPVFVRSPVSVPGRFR